MAHVYFVFRMPKLDLVFGPLHKRSLIFQEDVAEFAEVASSEATEDLTVMRYELENVGPFRGAMSPLRSSHKTEVGLPR